MNCITFDPPVHHADLRITIDFNSFEVRSGNLFGGIKYLSHGIHLISFGFADSEDAARYGYWFEIGPEYEYYCIEFDQQSGLFKLVSVFDRAKFEEKSRKIHPFMVSYPQIEDLDSSWSSFTNYIHKDQIRGILNNNSGYMDSSMTSLEEIKWLRTKLNQQPSNDEPFFNYTVIKFKSSDAIRDDHKMEDFLDKSYYLNNKIIKRDYQGHLNRLFGELQFSFLSVLLFGNYGSSLQWHNLIELICFSSEVDANTIKRIDQCVSLQLKRLSDEHSILLNEDMWKRCFASSFHCNDLPRIKEAIEPFFLEIADKSNDGDDHDDEDDEYKPTVAGGVYYQRV
ncbi:hypothetical protein HG535_0H01550 [Zygotorulaspora mrakii]|uniref:A1 cistron-splicing factor AAR2 n=1 Tax=Zygotorulaspora mrakii TaxID=42260 RepID=A0A7H9B7V0_ZYGMR|nr:uncharacterized protein HG535_0H01550 [Zygotorulaspora mrakii]QLG74828.1 hypothetical protein HG535_0H01550 [Zygotorulaspora mrakii]